MTDTIIPWTQLQSKLKGELKTDSLHQALYATDASIYRKYPLGAVFPMDENDLVHIVQFAREHGISLIPRTAGTSLAGQCVGEGLVVDVSKYMNSILEVNIEEKWVRLQPGVVRDELNAHLKPLGLHFGPNTSTANRCMIGGMVGNNSCGSSSIVYGSTRDHTLSLRTVLSDGSRHSFSELSAAEYKKHLSRPDLVGDIYRGIDALLRPVGNRSLIKENFPKPTIKRRNTGYAIDLLSLSDVYDGPSRGINICDLLCGSEGTLALTSEIKLHLDPLPSPLHNIVCAHFDSVSACMKATIVAMRYSPFMCEMMDKVILDCTKSHTLYNEYRWWVEGDPIGVLMIEIRGDSPEELDAKTKAMVDSLQHDTTAYAMPVLGSEHSNQAWMLRKAGLGLLANIPGEGKALACIEDTAVDLEDLPAFIAEFEQNMLQYGQQPVYYAHAGAGEIHLRPVLNIRTEKDREDLYNITRDTALLVKKYRGSLSGEHGDGRVRAPFIPLVMGDEVYDLFRNIKQLWDPKGIFNPGKIVDTAPMLEDLRLDIAETPKKIDTAFSFDNSGGLIGAVEMCNGSGDCRKLPVSGGTMCPSYHATRNEKDTTRGRANVLREFLQKHPADLSFDHPELKEVMDLCLSCKGCTSECPSNVDMSKIKAEYQYQLYKEKGTPLRARLIAENYKLLGLASIVPALSNFLFKNSITSHLLKYLLGMSPKRSIPLLEKQSLRRWYNKHYKHIKPSKPIKDVVLFCDEFTDYLDTSIGITSVQLLTRLNYNVIIINHPESGRSHISKGMLDRAKELANSNVNIFKDMISPTTPLIGIEPSAILTFRDEYKSLVDPGLKTAAQGLSSYTYTIEEFLINEVNAKHISVAQFDNTQRSIKLHGHCHQKALGSVDSSAHILSLPINHTVEVIPSGCCGMAGSFGYDKDKYEVSMQIGELVLFPSVRNAAKEVVIAAPGTSCRHQIHDGTSRKALHPVEILLNALK